jgi:hypothetical protein
MNIDEWKAVAERHAGHKLAWVDRRDPWKGATAWADGPEWTYSIIMKHDPPAVRYRGGLTIRLANDGHQLIDAPEYIEGDESCQPDANIVAALESAAIVKIPTAVRIVAEPACAKHAMAQTSTTPSTNPETVPIVAGTGTARPARETDTDLALDLSAKSRHILNQNPVPPAEATETAPSAKEQATTSPKTHSRPIASRNRAMRQASFL